MARLTVEDCIERIPNRFELVMLAAQRARELGSGAAITVDRDNDKNPVVALREIADETIDTDGLRRKLVYGGEPQQDDDELDGELGFGDEVGLSTEAVAAVLGGGPDEGVSDEFDPEKVFGKSAAAPDGDEGAGAAAGDADAQTGSGDDKGDDAAS